MTSIRRPFHVLVSVLFMVALLAAASVHGAPSGSIIYVKHDATGNDDGSSWGDAYTDLHQAMGAAQAGDEIWVAQGVYYPASDATDRSATFALVDGVALIGGFAGTETQRGQRDWEANVTVLSGDLDRNDTTDGNGVVTDTANVVGDNAYQVVKGMDIGATAVLEGFVVTAGLADGSDHEGRGGGMYNLRSSPTVVHVAFVGNQAASGGGMANWSSAPTLTDATFSDNQATISGGGMHNFQSSPTLTGVAFRGNQAAVMGGGMLNVSESHPTLTSVGFSDNQADRGGGMYNQSSNPTLTNVVFAGNQATLTGGGIYNLLASPTLLDITVGENQANVGGGMYNGQSSPTLTHVTFTGNRAGERGGGVQNHYLSSPILTNVIFSGNHAPRGGGMHNWLSSDPALINALFSGNRAESSGGGMYNLSESNPTLINVTLSGNRADDDSGGGMHNLDSSPTLVNCIVWGNAAPSDPQIHDEDGAAPSVTYSLVQGGYPGEGNIDADPLFVDALSAGQAPTTDGDYRLSEGSPAIDAGTNNAVTVDTDLDGNPRIADGTGDGNAVVDMGAYEFQIRTEPYLYVRHDATGSNDGSSWQDAYTDLQDALAEARTGDEIWVARGVYYPAPDASDRSATFSLVDGVALYGGFAGTETEREQRNWLGNITVLSGDLDRNDAADAQAVVTDPANIVGDNAYHVVTGIDVGATAVLDGFVITAGLADGSGSQRWGGGMYNVRSDPTLTGVTFAGNLALYGGGMYNWQSSPTLTRVTFTGNQVGELGGGMYSMAGSPTLTEATFTGNQANWGGGMYNNASTPTLTEVIFIGNQANRGGGMYNLESSPTLTGVTFADNQADHFGGGMYNSGGSPTLVDVTFIGNRAATDGAGLYNWQSRPTVTNAVFSGNQAGSSGGGMANANGSIPTLTNVTFSGNRAHEGAGGGMHNLDSSPTLVNCIVWGNAAPASPQMHNAGTSMPNLTYSLIQGGYAGEGNIDADPLFVNPVSADQAPTTAGDYRPRFGSPAIDAGTNDAVTVDTDLDGNPRIVDGTDDGNAIVDMGAYECQVRPMVYLPFVARNH